MKNITVLGRKQEDVGFSIITIVIIVTTTFTGEIFVWGLPHSSSQLVPEEWLSLFFLSLLLFLPSLFASLRWISSQSRSSAMDRTNKTCACKPPSMFLKQHPYDNGKNTSLNTLLKCLAEDKPPIQYFFVAFH